MLLKFVLRNIKKYLSLNLIKVIGLSLALCGILFITLFVNKELSYDKFHKNADRIYRYTYTNPEHFDGNHFARIYNATNIPEFCNFFPEIENYVRLSPIWGGVTYDQKYISVNQAFTCDSSFFDIFDIELLTGNSIESLKNPGTLIITESLAKKVFGAKDPIGQTLNLSAEQWGNNYLDYSVQAVIKDFPKFSHFHPEIIVTAPDQSVFKNWSFTYFLLSEHANPDNIISKAKDMFAHGEGKYWGNSKTNIFIQKLTDIHLDSNKLREIETNGNRLNIYVLSIVAVILLIISLSNYANLNIGMSGFSNKYLCINKFLGSSNKVNLKYFFTESMVISLFTIIITVILLIPFNFFLQKNYSLNLISGNIALITIIFLVFSLLNLVVGTIPVFVRSISEIKLKLIQVNNFKISRKGISRSLIIVQFAFSLILLIAIITINKQLNFVLQNSLGNNSTNAIYLESAQGKYQLFKEKLQKYTSIDKVTAMFTEFGGESNDMFGFKMEGYAEAMPDDKYNKIGVFPCDYTFPSFFDLNFLSGHDFTEKTEDNEGAGEYIINLAAMKRLQYSNPNEIIGKDFQIISNQPDVKIPKGKIIGVVEDFHLSSMKKKVVPLVMFKRKEVWLFSNIVAFKPGMQKEGIVHVKEVWNKLYPSFPFQYEYIEPMYKKIYNTEILQAKFLSIFTVVSLFICSIGLLGLTLLITQTRTKEIGVRKVNGAKIFEIVAMLNKSIVIWILLAFVAACPIGYYAMNVWLQNFAYKISLSWWIFILAGILTLVISIITASWQTISVAKSNPVKALRYE